jgi:hypothetical protein
MLFYEIVFFKAKPKTQEAYWISKKMSKSLDPTPTKFLGIVAGC